MLIELDLLQFQNKLQIKTEFGKYFIGDKIRNKYVAMTPEELVRQLMIHYLTEKLYYPKSKIQVEKSIKVNNMEKRFDILVYNTDIKPFMIIECKSYKIPIQQNQSNQVSLYNSEINAPYTLITNGNFAVCSKIDIDSKTYTFLNELPSYEGL